MGKVWRIKSQDATATPVVSGSANANAASLSLTVPTGYSSCLVKNVAAWTYGDNAILDGNATGGFYLMVANAEVTIPVMGIKTLYLKTSANTASQWYFTFQAENE